MCIPELVFNLKEEDCKASPLAHIFREECYLRFIGALLVCSGFISSRTSVWGKFTGKTNFSLRSNFAHFCAPVLARTWMCSKAYLTLLCTYAVNCQIPVCANFKFMQLYMREIVTAQTFVALQ